MKSRVLLLALVVLVSIPAAHAQMSYRVEGKTTETEAVKALAVFTSVVNSENYRQIGFDSVEEVRLATLDVPLKEFLVPLDRLQQYEADKPPLALLIDTGQVAFPVKVAERVRSSFTLANVRGEWKPVSFGEPNLHKLFAGTRDEHARSSGLQKASYFIVRIPALALVFLGLEQESGLTLLPILDDTAYRFKAGIGIPARDVFMAVREEARKHDGLPR